MGGKATVSVCFIFWFTLEWFFPPQCQVFTLHVLEYLFHLLKCYVSQMAFCDYCAISIIAMLHAACHLWKCTSFSSSRWVPSPQPFPPFPRVTLSSLEFRKKGSLTCTVPVFFRLTLWGMPAFPVRGSVSGTVNIPYIQLYIKWEPVTSFM